MPVSILCGNCGHKHSLQCKRTGCKCDRPTARPRPSPNLQAIKEHMKMNGLSYRGIARMSGVSVGQVWKVLKGVESPGYETLRRLAGAMGLSLERAVEMLGIRWRRT